LIIFGTGHGAVSAVADGLTCLIRIGLVNQPVVSAEMEFSMTTSRAIPGAENSRTAFRRGKE